MQLDRTRIVIRERGLLETLDLALHVTREFGGAIVLTSLMAIVPLAIVNYFVVGWMAPGEFDEETTGLRFMWHMALLIYLEAPLAAIFTVAYLGPAVFLEQRTVRQVMLDVLHYVPHLILCQGLMRGVLIVWAMYLCMDRFPDGDNQAVNVLLMLVVFMILCVSTALRAFRPYVNEIILLEKNPLRATQRGGVTIGQRSAHLHGPYSGDLFIRWVGTAAVGLFLALATLSTVVTVVGQLTSDWPFRFVTDPSFEILMTLSWIKLQVVYPACLWLVVMFLGVVRFLSYLDLRIRHEGWEIELLMRAEALRLAPQSL